VALNTALFENGALVSVPNNTVSDELVQLLFINTNPGHASGDAPHASYPRNLFVVGKNARLNLLIQHIGAGDQTYLSNCVQELVVDEGGEINVTLLQNENAQGWHFTGTRAFLQKNATASLNTISLGGKISRQSVRVLLRGEGATCHLNGLNVLKDSTEVFHNTVIEHWEPRCVSRQFYKGIVDDDTKSEFNGTIFVAPEAQQTDSEQMNRNLVLSDNARVYSRPQLEINADDVKCAHGATVGQLEDEQIFYLASRGIDAQTAESVLTYGFAEEIIQRVPQPEVRHYINGLAFKNLHQANADVVDKLSR
jgi:Fe-S cluster assembly protein SufD